MSVQAFTLIEISFPVPFFPGIFFIFSKKKIEPTTLDTDRLVDRLLRAPQCAGGYKHKRIFPEKTGNQFSLLQACLFCFRIFRTTCVAALPIFISQPATY